MSIESFNNFSPSFFKEWWTKLPELNRDIFYTHIIKHRFKYLFGFGAASYGSVNFYLNHLEQTPITKRTRFMIYSSKELEEFEQTGMNSVNKIKQINYLIQ